MYLRDIGFDPYILIVGLLLIIIGGVIMLVAVGLVYYQNKKDERGDNSTTELAKVVNVEKNKYGEQFVTLEFSDGNRKVLRTPLRSNIILVTGDKGSATYQGRTLLIFERL